MRRSHHEWPGPVLLSRTRDTCGTSMTPGFYSIKSSTTPMSENSSAIARHGSWALRMPSDSRCLNRLCLWIIARVQQTHQMSTYEVRRRVVGTESSSLTVIFTVRPLRCREHIFGVILALFASAGQRWEEKRIGQAMVQFRCLKEWCSAMGSGGPLRVSVWGPIDDDFPLLASLRDMAQNRKQ